ncbi:MAG: agmatinase family protein [Acidimicrobiia bacterium]|nr:agmatinase family protein [Acidimicrobiia bacterium]MDH3470730.1 agmatinase family protein [Acidimicrobiia bacterium]
MAKVFAFIGAPFDGGATLGWPGSRYAPDEIRRNLEWMKRRVEDGRIYWLDRNEVVPFGAEQLVDVGDAAVVAHDLEATLAAVRAATTEQAAQDRIPLVVGGDDSILFPAVGGVHDAVAGNIGIVHFDAHLDLMDHSEAQGRFSHSSGMRRALELERVDPARSVQIGVRNFNYPASKEFIDSVGLTEIPATEVHASGVEATSARIDEALADVEHIFVAVDADVLDPAHAPGVGWHEPGGLTSHQLAGLLTTLAPRARGLCLNEVNPMTDHRSQTTIAAANLLFQFAVAGAQG